ncbi:predicted protein [Naegleria gruberi]|uniref:Predicted protein n=1 Tax=Naegleria gruberi TaxID=5762 RepID=D2VE50_NAEGR|nr:uncharacterized protein NAEGRDRAFT_79609 [Naegleria gruberi]EFC44820.1 predicted protein [Naegleria gruberi]|eukprot:XP_002677564.1 predicted protein [Naegleria gruberi strain NEG-M]
MNNFYNPLQATSTNQPSQTTTSNPYGNYGTNTTTTTTPTTSGGMMMGGSSVGGFSSPSTPTTGYGFYNPVSSSSSYQPSTGTSSGFYDPSSTIPTTTNTFGSSLPPPPTGNSFFNPTTSALSKPVGPPPTELKFGENVHGAVGQSHHQPPTTGVVQPPPPSVGISGSALQGSSVQSESAFEQGHNFMVQDVISHMGTLTLNQQQNQQPFVQIVPPNNMPQPKDAAELLTSHVSGQPDVAPLYQAHYNLFREKYGSTENRPASEVFKFLQSDENTMKMSCNAVPQSLELLNRYGLPFGCVLNPFYQKEVPTIGGNFIVRCNNCRTYINPFVQFIEYGNKWQCNVCKNINEVPKRYYSPTDNNGVRQDFFERPELVNGVYEYLAPQEYMSRPPQPPAYLFLIDTSFHSINGGLFQSAVKAIKNCLKELKEKSPRTMVGILCFDTKIHFFNLRPTLSNPQQLVVGELNESLLPLPNDLLVNLEESYHLVEILLDKLELMFKGSTNAECCLGSALNAAGRLIGRFGGKVSIFLSQLPTIGPNKLTNRENLNDYGNEKAEAKLLQPADQSYRDFALLFNKDQICIDLYCYSIPESRNSFLDISTISNLSKFTGGWCKLYEYPDQLSHQLASDLKQNIIEEITGFESVMRIRVSSGMKIVNFFGNFFIRGHDLMALPNISGTQTFGFQMVHTGAMLSTPNVSVQVAVLYTSDQGQRKIRVCNLLLPITTSLSVLYNSTQTTCLTNLMGKILAADLPKEGITNSKNILIDKWLKGAVAGYKTVANVGSMGIVMPTALQYLPLFICGLSKSAMLIGGKEVRADGRSAASLFFSSCSIQQSTLMVHPLMINVSQLLAEESAEQENDKPKVLKLEPLSRKLINPDDGVYLLCDGVAIYIWLGKKQWDGDREKFFDLIHDLNFNKFSLQEEPSEVPYSDDALLTKVFDLCELFRVQLKSEMPVRIANAINETSNNEKFKKVLFNDFHRTFLKKLTEDKTLPVTMSYADIISYVSK